ncbi:MAG: DUF177 domain-containing protein [Pseudomonadota bacterium]
MAPRCGCDSERDVDRLKVRLDDIPASGLHLAAAWGRETIDQYVPERERSVFDLLEPVRVDLRLLRQGERIFVRGTVATRLGLRCDRCLALVEQAVNSEVCLTFMSYPESSEDAQMELAEDDLEVGFYGPGGIIDLREVVVEEVALAIPFKLLCNEACRGLCASCGADLNHEPCKCGPKSVDPRLAVLKDLQND